MDTEVKVPEGYISITEAVELTSVPRATLYRRIKRGEIQAIRVNKIAWVLDPYSIRVNYKPNNPTGKSTEGTTRNSKAGQAGRTRLKKYVCYNCGKKTYSPEYMPVNEDTSSAPDDVFPYAPFCTKCYLNFTENNMYEG